MAMNVDEFLAGWSVDPVNAKPVFEGWRKMLKEMPEVELSFKSRPGISHSLRASSRSRKDRPLFALLDVVDDEPENRWLSVCFYADLVSDPEGYGDLVPAGLEGEDAMCFNLDENDPEMAAYIGKRIEEAARAAK